MNNKLEVIGIDHGWSMMKTISQVFVTGVKEITTTPALFGDVLEYEGKFYKVGTVRQEVKDTKVEDDSFYLLTLAAVLKEYRNYGIGTELMKQMLMKLKLEGYKQASLAVQKMNYAVRMHRKVGFEIVDENDEEYIMICKL